MLQFLAGKKGTGKTKKLIDMANISVKTNDGHLVFIDDDRRHIYDLHYNIRFIETAGFPLSNYREFIGFVCGVLSADHDITEIFVDGLTNIIGSIDNESLVKLTRKLENLSAEHNVDFYISMNWDINDLPDELKELLAS